jgi:iron complex outermembrane recepter protein
MLMKQRPPNPASTDPFRARACFRDAMLSNLAAISVARLLTSVIFTVLIAALATPGQAESLPDDQQTSEPLKQLSLSELGDVEVTTVSKKPAEIWKTPAAIYVLTHEDIHRSGATNIPDVLRLVPGVEVARINSSQWSVGIRGFGSSFSKSVLVLIDGRSVYTPLYAGVYWGCAKRNA